MDNRAVGPSIAECPLGDQLVGSGIEGRKCGAGETATDADSRYPTLLQFVVERYVHFKSLLIRQ